MSEVQNGLRLAAPKISSKALGDLTADELLGGMNAETRTAMAAALAAEAPKPRAKADGPDETVVEEDDEVEAPAKKKPATKAKAAASDPVARMKTVFASDKVKGNEVRAAELLADDEFDGLSAEGILKILGTAPAVAASEDGDGKKMLAAMTVETEEIGRDGKAEGKAQKASSLWDSAIVANNPGHKIG